MNDAAWDVWLETPYIVTSQGIPLIYILGILVAAAATAGFAIKKFRKVEVLGLDKERVMGIVEQMTKEEVQPNLDEYTFGVVLSFFDQQEGPVPAIIIPNLLEDNLQFLVDLSDRSFSATGFVEETSDEKVTIFDVKLADVRMMCITYGFAIDNPSARGGKKNMTINVLIDPTYAELTQLFSPEILPAIRWLRSLIENKSPRETVRIQMEGLRRFVAQIITAYQEVYGENATLGEDGTVIVEG